MAVTKLTTSGVNNVVKSDSMLVGNRVITTKKVAFGLSSSPYVSVYDWFGPYGKLGTRYVTATTVPTSIVLGVDFNPAGTAIALSMFSPSPYMIAYPWDDSTGFGTKYADPGSLLTSFTRPKFSPSGNDVAVASSATPWMQIYPFSTSTGFGTKYTNPGTLPTGQGQFPAWNPAGNTIALSHWITPFVSVYPFTSGTGFGTKYADPATLPGGDTNGAVFNPAGTVLALSGLSTSPYIHAYAWSSGFGTKYANPASLPDTGIRDIRFSPNGNVIVVSSESTSPFIWAYAWSNSTGFGSKYADPATLPTSGLTLAWSTDGKALAMGAGTSDLNQNLYIYAWDDSTGFGFRQINSFNTGVYSIVFK